VSLAGFCGGCNIVSAFLRFRAARLIQLNPCSLPGSAGCSAQPHAARVRSWPWAILTIAWARTIEEVTEEQDLWLGATRSLRGDPFRLLIPTDNTRYFFPNRRILFEQAIDKPN
jgi:hypothetical protein